MYVDISVVLAYYLQSKFLSSLSSVCLVIVCRVERISWKRADVEPVRRGAWSLSDFDRRLTIHNVTRSDSSNYSCTADYEIRSGQQATTHVHQLTVTIELRVTGGKTYRHTYVVVTSVRQQQMMLKRVPYRPLSVRRQFVFDI